MCHGDWNQDRILPLFYKKNNSSIYCRRRANLNDPAIQQVRGTHCERGAPSTKDEFNASYKEGGWNCGRGRFVLKVFQLADERFVRAKEPQMRLSPVSVLQNVKTKKTQRQCCWNCSVDLHFNWKRLMVRKLRWVLLCWTADFCLLYTSPSPRDA